MEDKQYFEATSFDFTKGFSDEQKNEIIEAQPDLIHSAMVSIIARAGFNNNDFRYVRQEMSGIFINGEEWEAEIRLFKLKEVK